MRRQSKQTVFWMATAASLALLTACPALAQTQTGDAAMDAFGLTSKNKIQTTAAPQTTAKAAPVVAQDKTRTYLMSAFPATSQNTLSLFRSYDGATFAPLATETYTPAKGLLRDPSIIHAGNAYYVVYTTGWDGQTFGVAKSSDLRHWDHVGDITVDLPGVTNVWAPEWFRDSDGSIKVVVSLSKGGTKGQFAAYYLTANADMTTFSAPVLTHLECAALRCSKVPLFATPCRESPHPPMGAG